LPSSVLSVIDPIIKEAMSIRPKSILDIGLGYGKYGLLCREYLEGWKNRVFPKQWIIRIDGIEIFEPYTDLSWNEEIYDRIYVGDARKRIYDVGMYDLILAIDVIEHVEKDDGIRLIHAILEKCLKCAIINVPTGNWMGNVVVGGNPNEAHKAIWTVEDMVDFKSSKIKSREYVNWIGGRGPGLLSIFYVK
jgi:2-polyprenyl-3-methyl-5-hydroxy-6-metoxy-1,4-benzoquinol methylase